LNVDDDFCFTQFFTEVLILATQLLGFFVEGAAQRDARAVCTGCLARLDCLADALDSRMDFGVWGGMTERERRALLRRRPEVTSWRAELVPAGELSLGAR